MAGAGPVKGRLLVQVLGWGGQPGQAGQAGQVACGLIRQGTGVGSCAASSKGCLGRALCQGVLCWVLGETGQAEQAGQAGPARVAQCALVGTWHGGGELSVHE